MKRHLLILCILLGLVGTRASAYDFYQFEKNCITYSILDGVVSADVHSDYPYSTLTIDKVTHNGNTYLIDRVDFDNPIEEDEGKPVTLYLQKLTIGPNVTGLHEGGYYYDIKEIIFEDGEKTMTIYGSNGTGDLWNLRGTESIYCGRNIKNPDPDSSPFRTTKETLKSIAIGNKVTTIGQCIFSGLTNITDIEIPSSVETIEDKAFSDCTKLETVIIKGNPTIKYRVFDGCTSLKTIGGNGPKIVEYDAFRGLTNLETISLSAAEEIGNDAFAGCTNLSAVSLDNCVTIGTRAFDGCFKLKTVNLGNKVSQIHYDAFRNCISLSSISIPGSVADMLDDRAFSGCTSLKSVTFGEGITVIGSESFINCSSLNSVEFPNSLTYIESKAFYGCTKLQALKFPGNIRGIQQSAFENCTGITTLQFAKLNDQAATYGSLSINDAAFKNCTSLTSFVAPDGPAIDYGYGSYVFPTNISQQVFYGCTNLKTVEFTGMSFYPSSLAECPNLKSITLKNTLAPHQVINDYTLPNKLFTSATLYVPNDLVDSYKTHNYWKQFTNIQGIDATGEGSGGDDKTTLIEYISLNTNSYSMSIGDIITLIATISPNNATNKTVKWSSSNTTVAKVNDYGVVTAQAKGSAIITATAMDGSNVSNSCIITVRENSIDTPTNRSGIYQITYDDILTDGNTYPWTPPTDFTITIDDDGTTCYISNIFGKDVATFLGNRGLPFTYIDKYTAVAGKDGYYYYFYKDYQNSGYIIARPEPGNDDYLYLDVNITFDESGKIYFGDLYILFFPYDSSTDSYPNGTAIYVYKNLVATKIASSIEQPISNTNVKCHVSGSSIILSEEFFVQVYNTTGGLVYTGVTSRVDNLSKGMYIVKMGDKTQKVIIK